MDQYDRGRRLEGNRSPRWDWMAFAWGLLEAVTLFIVPDTWISRRALISSRAGLVAVYSALPGAILGGVAIYLAALRFHVEILAFYDWLPGIGPNLIAKAGDQLEQSGALALFLGGYTGTPYKLYAAQASATGIGLTAFVAVSIISRGSRFLFTAVISSLIGRSGRRFGIRLSIMLWLHAVVWILFYAFYWSAMADWQLD